MWFTTRSNQQRAFIYFWGLIVDPTIFSLGQGRLRQSPHEVNWFFVVYCRQLNFTSATFLVRNTSKLFEPRLTRVAGEFCNESLLCNISLGRAHSGLNRWVELRDPPTFPSPPGAYRRRHSRLNIYTRFIDDMCVCTRIITWNIKSWDSCLLPLYPAISSLSVSHRDRRYFVEFNIQV